MTGEKIYSETLYYAKRVSAGGGQRVFKQILPDGIPTELSPGSSQKLRNHSPDGFQWSYCGSGPAQLALALLLDVTSDPEMAMAHYQDFKFDKVAAWGEEWRITSREILDWLKEEQSQALERAANSSRN